MGNLAHFQGKLRWRSPLGQDGTVALTLPSQIELVFPDFEGSDGVLNRSKIVLFFQQPQPVSLRRGHTTLPERRHGST
jgi:hypothetical protein